MIPATGSRGILQERRGKVTRSCRKIPEIARTWKQYSNRKLTGFFPVDSSQLPVLSGRNRSEIIGKNPKIYRPEYCFHKITGITWNRQFPGRFVRPGLLAFITKIISSNIRSCRGVVLKFKMSVRAMTPISLRHFLENALVSYRKCVI